MNDIDDRLSRLLGIPAFGLAIPHLTGLFGPVGPSHGAFWAGTLLFVALAWAIWEGNRWLLFRQRERRDWFHAPLGKLVFLVVGCVLFTGPLTAAVILGWFFATGLPVDAEALRSVVLTNVICVLVVTHFYETVFLIKARRDDLVALERLQRTRVEAELAALRSQVDPHFLFNSLTSLGWLIERDPVAASEFNARLASSYRYILANRDRDLVLLADELAFFGDCVRLLEVRFGAGLLVRIELRDDAAHRFLLPPISLQVLLENAVKHTTFSPSEPLELSVVLAGEQLTVRNPRRERSDADSTGVGLANLGERCRLLLGRELRVRAEDGVFEVGLPMMRMGA